MNRLRGLITQNLWKNNSVIVQLVGLCPILAVTSTASNAIGLGLVTTLVLTLTNFLVSLFRLWISKTIRIPICIMIIGSAVSIVDMLVNAFAFDLYQSLGIFISLITTNCIVLGRAEVFAIKNRPIISALDGFSTGMGITCVMFFLGLLREVCGNGTLFIDSDVVFGNWSKVLYTKIFYTNTPFLLWTLPPGAFISLGMLLAIKRLIDNKCNKDIKLSDT